MFQIRVTLATLLLTAIAPISMSCASTSHVEPKSSTTADSTLPESVVSTSEAAPVVKPKQPSKSSPVEIGKLRAPSKEDLANLKALDLKYKNSKSISMDLEKNLKLGILNQERKSKGRLLISQGRMRMEIDKPEQSLVVVDKKNIWVVQYPPEDLVGASLQVIRASAETKKGRSQSFIGLLVKGGITKYFKVLNAMTSQDGSTTYFLQPEAGTVEFARAQVTLDSTSQQLKELKYWDELSNETTFVFSKISFDKKIAADKFAYTPPKNADVTTY